MGGVRVEGRERIAEPRLESFQSQDDESLPQSPSPSPFEHALPLPTPTRKENLLLRRSKSTSQTPGECTCCSALQPRWSIDRLSLPSTTAACSFRRAAIPMITRALPPSPCIFRYDDSRGREREIRSQRESISSRAELRREQHPNSHFVHQACMKKVLQNLGVRPAPDCIGATALRRVSCRESCFCISSSME